MANRKKTLYGPSFATAFIAFNCILFSPLAHAAQEETPSIFTESNCFGTNPPSIVKPAPMPPPYIPDPTVPYPVGLSPLDWNSGCWVNGGNDRLQVYQAYVERLADAVTQSMPVRVETWANFAGADSDSQLDNEFNQPPATFNPRFGGVFHGTSWMSHVWGNGLPAREHRKRIIHLAWMDPIPDTIGNGYRNGNYRNPRVWRQVMDGEGDKYAFLLGRKFAYLDEQYGDTAFPMTIDLAYEFTLEKHKQLPEGSYMDGATLRYAYQDFPYGYARMARVFREGYAYQRGRPCPYRFSFRPQLRFIVADRTRGNQIIRHEQLFPNLVANWQIPNPVVINGVTVLPAGPIGAQVQLVGASWHDSSKELVRGSSATAPGNNWAKINEGFPTHWGLQEIADFAAANNVRVAFPEWGARGAHEPPVSTHPGDFYRITYDFFVRNKAILEYETVFDIGGGNLYRPWEPAQPPEQEPRLVYKQLWGNN